MMLTMQERSFDDQGCFVLAENTDEFVVDAPGSDETSSAESTFWERTWEENGFLRICVGGVWIPNNSPPDSGAREARDQDMAMHAWPTARSRQTYLNQHIVEECGGTLSFPECQFRLSPQ